MGKAILLFSIMTWVLMAGCAAITATEPLTITKENSPKELKLAIAPMGFFEREFKGATGGEETASDRVKKIALGMNCFQKVDKISSGEVQFAVVEKGSPEDILRKMLSESFSESFKEDEKISLDKDYVSFAKVKGYDLILHCKVISIKYDDHINPLLFFRILLFGGLLGMFIPDTTHECELIMEMAVYDINKEEMFWQKKEIAIASKVSRDRFALELREKLKEIAFNNAVITGLEDLRSKFSKK